jgi:transposase
MAAGAPLGPVHRAAARSVYDPAHPLGCRRPRIADRIIFEKLVQVLRFGCSDESIADCTCAATTIRERRDEWIRAGIFGRLRQIAREAYDRIVGLILQELAVDGCITKAPGGGQCAGRSPAGRGKQGMKRSLLVEGHGIPLGRVLAPASRPDSPLLAATLDKLGDLGPLPDDITVCLDAGYDSQKTRDELAARGMTGEITHKGGKAPIQAGQRWHVERTNRLAQRLQPAAALLRAARRGHRRLLRPRRLDHHRPQPYPAGMGHLPVGHPAHPSTMITSPNRAAS